MSTAIFCIELRVFSVIRCALYDIEPAHDHAVFVAKKHAAFGIRGRGYGDVVGGIIDLDAARHDAAAS